VRRHGAQLHGPGRQDHPVRGRGLERPLLRANCQVHPCVSGPVLLPWAHASSSGRGILLSCSCCRCRAACLVPGAAFRTGQRCVVLLCLPAPATSCPSLRKGADQVLRRASPLQQRGLLAVQASLGARCEAARPPSARHWRPIAIGRGPGARWVAVATNGTRATRGSAWPLFPCVQPPCNVRACALEEWPGGYPDVWARRAARSARVWSGSEATPMQCKMPLWCRLQEACPARRGPRWPLRPPRQRQRPWAGRGWLGRALARGPVAWWAPGPEAGPVPGSRGLQQQCAAAGSWAAGRLAVGQAVKPGGGPQAAGRCCCCCPALHYPCSVPSTEALQASTSRLPHERSTQDA
jgi:hypothetical protein